MRKSPLKLFLPLVLCVCLMLSAAIGETERGDLSQRFSNAPQIEYNGEVFSRRSRMTTVLLMGVAMDETLGTKVSDFTALVAVDDNEKWITPIRFSGNTLVTVDGGQIPLRQVFALKEDPNEGCMQVVAAVNSLLGEELIDSYFAFDVEGAYAVDGYVPVEGGTEAQLRALKALLEQKSLDELSSQYALLGDYIISDMKSGAVMKLADKAERYEMPHSVPLPTIDVMARDAEGQELPFLIPNAEEILPLIVSVFYEESQW